MQGSHAGSFSSTTAPSTPMNSPSVQSTAPSTTKGMESEEMESKMWTCGNRLSVHPALGRSPQEVTDRIQVISLGSSCGVKMTLRRLGVDQATMPFDWMRSTSKGVMSWLRDDFNEYFRTPFHKKELTFRNIEMTVYRCATHSFWHDDMESIDTREKLWRRVQRFLALDKDDEKYRTPYAVSGRPLLFVRTTTTTGEVEDSEEMYELLQQKFARSGRKVWLLVIVDDQNIVGPIMHSSFPRLLFWVKPLQAGPLPSQGEGSGPYEDAVAFMCRRILGDPELVPGGQACMGAWPHVKHSFELRKPGPFLLKETEAGTWAGNVIHKDATEETMFAAFEGYSEREIAYPKKP